MKKKSFQTGLFGIGRDSLVFKGESPSATLEIWSKIGHCTDIYWDLNFTSTVKFLIVAASPINPQNFQKISIFLQKVSYFENLQLKPHGDF